MAAINIVFLVAYFVGVAVIGYWSSHKSLASSKSDFLDGAIGWTASGAGLFASNISAKHSIRFSDREASFDLAVGQFNWIASIGILYSSVNLMPMLQLQQLEQGQVWDKGF